MLLLQAQDSPDNGYGDLCFGRAIDKLYCAPEEPDTSTESTGNMPFEELDGFQRYDI